MLIYKATDGVTSNPSGETASGEVSHSIFEPDNEVGRRHRSSSLTVSRTGHLTGDTVTVLFRCNGWLDRNANTRNQSFSSTSSNSGDSSIDPSLGADLQRSTGGLN